MPRIVRTVVVITVLLGIARGASAQRPVLASSDAPRAEIGLYGGLWNLEPSGQVGLGGRVAINRSQWLGTEISLEAKHGETNSTTQRALIVNACAKAADRRAKAFGQENRRPELKPIDHPVGIAPLVAERQVHRSSSGPARTRSSSRGSRCTHRRRRSALPCSAPRSAAWSSSKAPTAAKVMDSASEARS